MVKKPISFLQVPNYSYQEPHTPQPHILNTSVFCGNELEANIYQEELNMTYKRISEQSEINFVNNSDFQSPQTK